MDQGLRVLAEAMAGADETGERWYEAELNRLKGELIQQKEKKEAEREAEACFHRAIEVARRQQVKAFELRATVSLGRLWQKQGKKAEAHRMLQEIYGWFTEGFDTVDLKAARALLDDLS